MADSRPERADFRPEKADFRPEQADFRPERVWGGRTDGRTSGPLPCLSFQFTIMQSRATGIADHVLPLGDLFFFRTKIFVRERFQLPFSE